MLVLLADCEFLLLVWSLKLITPLYLELDAAIEQFNLGPWKHTQICLHFCREFPVMGLCIWVFTWPAVHWDILSHFYRQLLKNYKGKKRETRRGGKWMRRRRRRERGEREHSRDLVNTVIKRTVILVPIFHWW